MVEPTVENVKTWSLVDFAGLGFTDEKLTVQVTRAVDYVEDVTGRTFATMPTAFETTAQEAVQRRCEQAAFQSQQDYAETGADDLIKTFSAGSYSETKRSPEEMRKAQMVNPWPLLHDLLWRMMTEDKRDQWREWFGIIVPAFETTEVDWQAMGNWPLGDSPFIFGA